jgi:UDP-2,3-diacylglucosamine pyrophosphatase LpxH
MHNEKSRILVISDLHLPFAHKDWFSILSSLKKEIRPDKVICIGDELDYHSFSYHERNVELLGPNEEFERAKEMLHKLTVLFPVCYVLHSNHGSLPFRKMSSAGLLTHKWMKPYEELLEVPKGWKWYKSILLNNVMYAHQMSINSLMAAKTQGCSIVQGHYHTKLDIQFWTRGFGMTVGCLIDDNSPAFEYNKNQIARPIIGTGAIIDGIPRLYRI